MKKESSKNIDQLGQWVKSAGFEAPSPGFSQRVLAQISLLPKKEYEPVISTFGLKLILGYILTLFILTWYLFPAGNSSKNYWPKLHLDNLPNLPRDLFYYSLPPISITEPMFFGLGTFMILSLASWWFNSKDKNYQI